MILEQFYLGCLSQASYLVADEASRRAIVVDPCRDFEDYLAFATDHALTIERVILTHVHADFVPGYAELADVNGATVAMSAEAPLPDSVLDIPAALSLALDEGGPAARHLVDVLKLT